MDNTQLLTDNLKWAPAKFVSAAERLVELKNKKSPWEVIEEIVRLWEATNPKEWESFIVTLDETKHTRKITSIGGKQFRGVSVDKGTGGILRYKLDIPQRVVYMIRRIFPEMSMDKEFMNQWARKFPKMVVEEVI